MNLKSISKKVARGWSGFQHPAVSSMEAAFQKCFQRPRSFHLLDETLIETSGGRGLSPSRQSSQMALTAQEAGWSGIL
jgi:hypothetical protein